MADILHRKFYALIADPAARNTFPASFEDPQVPVNPPGTGPLGGSKWFDLLSGIYYASGPVVVGRNEEFTGDGATFKVRTRYTGEDTTIAVQNFFEVRGANNAIVWEASSGTASGGVPPRSRFPQFGTTFGGADILENGFAFRASNSSDAVPIYRISNGLNQTLMDIRGGGRILFPDADISGIAMGTGAQTNFTYSGLHVSARGVSSGNNSLRASNYLGVTRFQVFNNGNISMNSLPTSDPLIAGYLWNDTGTVKISAG